MKCKTDMLVKDRYICKYELSGKWSGVLLCCSVTVNDTEQLKPISSIKLRKRDTGVESVSVVRVLGITFND